MGALALRPADLRDFDGEARVQDLRLGEVLGYGDPKAIRRVIRRNEAELLDHGILGQLDRKIPGSGRGRAERFFMLNEAQALLVTMFSRTEKAADARRQIITVFMAYRQGKLAPVEQAAPRRDAMADLVARMELLERAVGVNHARDDPQFALAIAHMPGSKAKRRYPDFWSDLPIRRALIAAHRQMSIPEIMVRLAEEHGRCPSKSAIHRFWMWLDEISGKRVGGVH